MQAERGGFTLLEVMLAVAISAMTLALAGLLVQFVMRTLERQQEQIRGPRAAATALRHVDEVLRTAAPPTEDPATRFELVDEEAGPRLRFARAARPSHASEPAWSEVRLTEIRLDPGEGRGAGRRLVCLERPPLGPDADRVVTNLWMRGVRGLEIFVWGGGAWQTAWPAEGESPSVPAAVRVALSFEGADGPSSLERVIAIPAGMTVTSRLERAVAE